MARQINTNNPVLNVRLAPGDKERLLKLAEEHGKKTINNLIQSIASGDLKVLHWTAALALEELIRIRDSKK